MINWNHDGKIDYKDHAFYNNVVEPGSKKSENNFAINGGNKKSSASSTEGNVKGIAILVGITVLYLIIKLIES